jgi:hypothetical protein
VGVGVRVVKGRITGKTGEACRGVRRAKEGVKLEEGRLRSELVAATKSSRFAQLNRNKARAF